MDDSNTMQPDILYVKGPPEIEALDRLRKIAAGTENKLHRSDIQVLLNAYEQLILTRQLSVKYQILDKLSRVLSETRLQYQFLAEKDYESKQGAYARGRITEAETIVNIVRDMQVIESV